jgi:hypothetical protein
MTAVEKAWREHTPRPPRFDSTAVSRPVRFLRDNKKGSVSLSIERRDVDPQTRRMGAQYVKTALFDVHRQPDVKTAFGRAAIRPSSRQPRSATAQRFLSAAPCRIGLVGDWADHATPAPGCLRFTEGWRNCALPRKVCYTRRDCRLGPTRGNRACALPHQIGTSGTLFSPLRRR